MEQVEKIKPVKVDPAEVSKPESLPERR